MCGNEYYNQREKIWIFFNMNLENEVEDSALAAEAYAHILSSSLIFTFSVQQMSTVIHHVSSIVGKCETTVLFHFTGWKQIDLQNIKLQQWRTTIQQSIRFMSELCPSFHHRLSETQVIVGQEMAKKQHKLKWNSPKHFACTKLHTFDRRLSIRVLRWLAVYIYSDASMVLSSYK